MSVNFVTCGFPIEMVSLSFNRLGKTYHERKKHPGSLPFICSDCSLGFGSKNALNYHTTNQH
jgi:hypothetical protein